MELNIKMHLVKKVKFIYPEFSIDTHDYPELEGKTLDEMRVYIEKHANKMRPLNENFDSLLDEIHEKERVVVLEEYPEESLFFVTAEDEYSA